MKKHLLNFSKIFAKSIFKFILLLSIGMLFCVVTFLMSLFFFSGKSGGNGFHGGGGLAVIFLVFTLFSVDFWAALLFFSSILLMPIYFIVAQKSAMQTAIHLLCKNHLTDWITPIITKYNSKISNALPRNIHTAADWTMVKVRLLETNKSDTTTPKMQRRVMKYLLTKIKLDDVDLSQSNLSLSDIVTGKINNAINDASQPSYNLFLLCLGGHILLTVTVLMMR